MDESQTPQPQVAAHKQQKIVIVEDDVSLADIYKTRLELIGYQCVVAADGIAALYFVQKEQPDLVLLDLMVPDIAGDEILKRMRISKWGKDVPVLIISNLNEADAPAGLRELGIVNYLVKANLSDDQLDQVVNNILKAPVSAPAPPEPNPSADQSPDASSVVSAEDEAPTEARSDI